MVRLSSSADRGSFGKKKYLEKREQLGKDTDQATLDMLEYLDRHQATKKLQEQDLEWQKDNLEYDLRTSEVIIQKAKASKAYAQNIYAALCNNDFQKNDTWPILADIRWACSWRYAGGIVADIREEGDYIDWYCSGIRDVSHNEDQNKSWDLAGYVSESVVTDEVREDLKQLGWVVIDNDNTNI